jgi:hypothetical protein
MENEACPVCWRDFGREDVPVCLGCGHSFCLDCSSHLRSCSLCRQKIGTTFQRKPNFALLSLIEKATSRQEVERASQATQTEAALMQVSFPQRDRARGPAVSVLEGKSMLVQVKRTGINLEFK